MAAKVKLMELAKELGVTSKELMVAADEMGHKGLRAMSPLDSALANALMTDPATVDEVASAVAPQAELDVTLVQRVCHRVQEQIEAAVARSE